MDQFESWIGTGSKIFTLLYSITRDGCVAETFHQKCDNQGATVTVLYNQQGSVYGGYTSVSWNCSCQYIRDDKAFLYQLRFSENNKYNKFPCTKRPDCAIYARSGYGPTFGGNHDLHTFQSTVNSSGGYFALNGYINWGHSYDNQGVTADNVNNDNMNVTELEVYKVTDGKRQTTTVILEQKSWRKTPEQNEKYLAKLMEEIENIKPMSDVDISEFRILMLGPVGSGKSSFYNTIDSIFRGRISNRAVCGNGNTSTTTAYTPYDVLTKAGSALKFSLCDTRGLEETQGIDLLDCTYLLDGHVPDYYEFNPANPITLESPDFVFKPTLDNKAHCVVFFIDAPTVDDMSAKLVVKMNSFRNIMNLRKLPQALVLTQVDKISEQVRENATKVFKCKEAEKVVEKVSSMLGIPVNNILPVKNYSSEMYPDDNVSILAMMAMQKVLYLAEDYTVNLRSKAKRSLRMSSHNRATSEREVTESDTA